MRKKKSRLLHLVIVTLLLFAFITGCSAPAGKAPTASTSGAATEAAATQATTSQAGSDMSDVPNMTKTRSPTHCKKPCKIDYWIKSECKCHRL